MKKLKKPGDNISLKTKKNESPAVMDWINSQTNLMDSLRYLIENEIQSNGVRNLQNFVPAERAFGLGELAGAAAAVAAAIQAHPVPPAASLPAMPVDDDIDDEDIDSWI